MNIINPQIEVLDDQLLCSRHSDAIHVHYYRIVCQILSFSSVVNLSRAVLVSQTERRQPVLQGLLRGMTGQVPSYLSELLRSYSECCITNQASYAASNRPENASGCKVDDVPLV